ncbi:sensor domain-containing diguanylate cyclase [Catenovulum adriaticum]|uniref:Sensor domain-containing diguanylate cyclase n=1 Tax=Catenovulum adriaticum TaxID=2984846 RepID=A0ABY7ASE2_9ALTE|nr:sensor domain-containing diguanylate cyclase [Catenovulum sp. TS8]WAJ72240.1 sensor domain-containing diguanylate cyclase [Catenovulum sp. TS8]
MKTQIKGLVGLSMLLSILVFGLGIIQAEILNSVRSYVYGEGLWAKAQKKAVYHLNLYILYSDQTDYQAFLTELNKNEGDKIAKHAMLQTPFNFVEARHGFIQSGNHPDDVNGMIYFFKYFRNMEYLKKAIKYWDLGDVKLAELKAFGQQIQQAKLNQEVLNKPRLLNRLQSLDAELEQVEKDFSTVLGEGARWVKATTTNAIFIILVILFVCILALARRILFLFEQTEKALVITENKYQSLYQSELLGILDWKEDGSITGANQAFLQMVGYSQQELQNGQLNWKSMTPPDCYTTDARALDEIRKDGYCRPFSKVFVDKSGNRIPVYISAVQLCGYVDRGIAVLVDQTVQMQAEEKMRLAATVLESSRDGLVILDLEENVVDSNQAYSIMTSYSKAELLESSHFFSCLGLTEQLQTDIRISTKEKGHWAGDTNILDKNDHLIPVRLAITTAKDDVSNIEYLVASFTDISARKVFEKKLQNMAHYDYLTGLANRSLYQYRLNQALTRAQRLETQCALLFIDLDKFKPVNDQYGHDVGDQLLKQVAQRLILCIRDNDTIARLGGDEFVVIIEDLEEINNIHVIADKINLHISEPYFTSGIALEISCSVGICIYPQDGQNTVELTRAADKAMYSAKKSMSGYCYYQPDAADNNNNA